MAREDQDSHIRQHLGDAPCCLDTTQALHLEVHKNYLGPKPLGHLKRLLAIFCFAHDLDAGGLLEQRSQPFAHDDVVVDQENVTDTYPRAFATDVLAAGAEQGIVRTRFGLDLIPRHDLASLPGVDRMLVPGAPDASAAALIERWGASNQRVPVERVHASGGYAYDLRLQDMARHETRLIASHAAGWIEYPTAQLDLGTHDWSLAMLARPVGLLALGALLALGLRWRPRRPQRRLVPVAA